MSRRGQMMSDDLGAEVAVPCHASQSLVDRAAGDFDRRMVGRSEISQRAPDRVLAQQIAIRVDTQQRHLAAGDDMLVEQEIAELLVLFGSDDEHLITDQVVRVTDDTGQSHVNTGHIARFAGQPGMQAHVVVDRLERQVAHHRYGILHCFHRSFGLLPYTWTRTL